MFSMRRRNESPSMLIWEYLDGEISEKRCGLLSRMLERRASVREQLVESAALHGMLAQHFGSLAETEEPTPRKRHRGGRTSAA